MVTPSSQIWLSAFSRPMRTCTTAIASIAHRYFQFGVTARTEGGQPEAQSRRTMIMNSTEQTTLARRAAPSLHDRTASWIARLFSQPVVRQIPQVTEWDND